MLSLLVACLPALVPQDVLIANGTDAGAPIAGMSVVTAGPAFAAASIPGAAPTLMPGWPVPITTHANFHPTRNVALVDLDGDARMEIVRPSTDGNVYVFRHDGTPLPGWPRAVNGWAQVAPAIGDLDGDGYLELVVATRGLTSGGWLYVLARDGTVWPGWPRSLSNNNVEGVTLADLDGDGLLEILATERVYPLGRVHALRRDGSSLPGWPVTLDHVPALTPAVGDVDGDGRPEIVMASYQSLYVFDAAGQVEPGWPVQVRTAYNANFSYQSPALADLDGDGKLEIAICMHQGGSGCYVFRHDGSPQPGWPQAFAGTWSYTPPTICDLDADGQLDVIAGRAGGTSPGAAVFAWNRHGQLLAGFPYVTEGGAESPLTVADIDLDPELEIFFGTSVMQSNQGFLHCIDAAGRPQPGFPLRTNGFTYLNGATIGDVDGDRLPEIAVLANNGTNGEITLWKLTGRGLASPIHWKGYHEGNERRGLFAESDRHFLTGHATRGSLLFVELQGTRGNVVASFVGARPAVVPVADWGILRLDPTLPIVPFIVVPLTVDPRAVQMLTVPVSLALGTRLVFQGVEIGASVRLRQMQMVTVR